jgi:pyridoxamine 5'-phosphate oxidase
VFDRVNKRVIRACSNMEPRSDLSFIEVKDTKNPVTLLKEWIAEGKQCGAHSSFMNLATATKSGKVSNRTVVIREIMADGSLTFMAQERSNKIKDINENPQVAATILLIYKKSEEKVGRQIRLTGIAERLSAEQGKVYFEKDSLSAKIRSWICEDCTTVDWNELKIKHDQLLKEVIENKKVLEMPDTEVAYKIIPNEIDFYFSTGGQIADRLLFKRAKSAEWTYERLMS